MTVVQQSSGFRKDDDDTLWVVIAHDERATTLAAWVNEGGPEPVRRERSVPTAVLREETYGWRPVEYDEDDVVRDLFPRAGAAGEAQAVSGLTARGIPVTAALRMVRTGEDEAVARETTTHLWYQVIAARSGLPNDADRGVLRDVMVDYPAVAANEDGVAFLVAELDRRLSPEARGIETRLVEGVGLVGVPAGIELPREESRRSLERSGAATTREAVDELRRELLELVPPILTRAGQLAGSLVRVLQDASGFLDECYGPEFVGYYCHECGRVIAEDTLRLGPRFIASTVTWEEIHANEGGGVRGVTCWGSHHAPVEMRRVLCRVTPEDPDRGVASPATSEGVREA